MTCPNCGRVAEGGVRFCPNCGTQIGSAGYTGGTGYPPSAARLDGLVRPRYPRMIAGVCSAFALRYGIDITLLRVLTAVCALLTSGFVGLCYLAAWVIIPDAPYTLTPGTVYTPVPPPPGPAGNPTV